MQFVTQEEQGEEPRDRRGRTARKREGEIEGPQRATELGKILELGKCLEVAFVFLSSYPVSPAPF